MKTDNVIWVMGYIDAYGAIHHHPCERDDWMLSHCDLFPNQTHKTWRFIISNWHLMESSLSNESLTNAEREDVIAFIEKHYDHPTKNKD